MVEDLVEKFSSPRKALYVISETENTLFLDYSKLDLEDFLSLLIKVETISTKRFLKSKSSVIVYLQSNLQRVYWFLL
ncbi:hypothetical protein [Streptococcus caledonicus]|uniref:hypothetical protein n=1 Tax=Streptococcus caledonicus TaxID=2614158 RepID=UPI0012EA261F